MYDSNVTLMMSRRAPAGRVDGDGASGPPTWAGAAAAAGTPAAEAAAAEAMDGAAAVAVTSDSTAQDAWRRFLCGKLASAAVPHNAPAGRAPAAPSAGLAAASDAEAAEEAVAAHTTAAAGDGAAT